MVSFDVTALFTSVRLKLENTMLELKMAILKGHRKGQQFVD